MSDEKPTPLEILVDGKKTIIPARKMNVICHPQGVRIDVPDRVEISGISTINRMARMSQQEWDVARNAEAFLDLFSCVFPQVLKRDFPGVRLPEDISELNRQDMGVIHICGMIVQIFEANYEGKELFFRLPESHLHPAAQANLSNLFCKLGYLGQGEQEQDQL